MKKQADQSRLRKGEVTSVEDDEDEDFDDKANYIYMELRSTVAFRSIDIDQMLQHTTIEDFLRGLYIKATDGPSKQTAGKLGSSAP